MLPVRITRIGNSSGMILPREVLRKLRLERGDTAYLEETADGHVLTRLDPDDAAMLEAGRNFMGSNDGAFSALAKA